jgi:hypothetical protein
MRKLFLSVALLATAVTPALSQTPSKPQSVTDAEQTVMKLTHAWLEAEERVDRATLRRIIADDFQGTGPRGNTVLKDDVIPEEGSQGGLSLNVRDVKARVFGETAVVTGSGVKKSGEKGELRFTVIYTRRGDSWLMVAGHLSAVPRE